MYCREDSIIIEGNEARFFLVTNAGTCGFPVNVGLAQGREMARAINRICDQLERHMAERDVAELFGAESRAREAEVLDRILDGIQATPHLPERIGEMAVSIGDDGEESERFDGRDPNDQSWR